MACTRFQMDRRLSGFRPTLFSDLPIELLALIFEKLGGKFEDVLSCASVCVSWRSAIRSRRFKRNKPLIILVDKPPKDVKEPPSHQRLYLFDTESNKSHVIHVRKLTKQWFHNCSNGWLLRIGSKFPHGTYFVNPVTLSEIKLPPLGKQFQRSFRVITSSSPSDPKCVVLGGYLDRDVTIKPAPNHMMFCRPGDQAWTQVILDRDDGVVIWYDIILYKNQFYGVSAEFLYRISFDGHAEKLIPLPPNEALFPKNSETDYYLLDFNGDLVLVVCRFRSKPYHLDFKIYKMKFDGEKIWIKMQNLGKNEIYLQTASSVAVSPGRKRCCETSLYFFEYVLDQRCIRGSYFSGLTSQYSWLSNEKPVSTTATQWFTHYEL